MPVDGKGQVIGGVAEAEDVYVGGVVWIHLLLLV
jgi:hypothetical protein